MEPVGADALLSGHCRAGTFESFDQSRDRHRWMQATQQVDVSLNHANLQHIGAFLSGHCPEKPAQEPSQLVVYEPLTFARGPDEMDVEAMAHETS